MEKVLKVEKGYKAIVSEDGKTITLVSEVEFKDGDFIFVEHRNGNKYISIFKEIKNDSVITYCDWTENKGYLFKNEDSLLFNYEIKEIRLATEEEKDNLLEKLKEIGYIFNFNKLEKFKAPKIGELCIFWDNSVQYPIDYVIDILEKEDDKRYEPITCKFSWDNCILYDKETYKKLINY